MSRSSAAVKAPRALRMHAGGGKRPYGFGASARRAFAIAHMVAEDLGDARLDGRHARELILQAASRCPLVLTQRQAQAVVDGWEGAWIDHGISPAMAICHSAGRQLALLRGLL